MKRLFSISILFLSMAVLFSACSPSSPSSNLSSTQTGTSTLTLTKSTANAGTVTSNPSGISCDTTCTTQSASFPSGSNVILTTTANAAVSATFSGWSGGGCSGTGSCSVQLSSNTSVTANFAERVALPKNALGLFVVTIGGSSPDYTPYGTIDSTSYLYSMVIPSTQQWVVLSK